MDQNSFFQNPFEVDFFSSVRLPNNLAFSDPFDIFSRRKDSLLSLGSPRHKSQMHHDFSNHAQLDTASLFAAPKHEDMHFDQNNAFKIDSMLKDWQGVSMPSHSESTLDPLFNRDFTFNPYQICRSRAGSFNYGRFRRDSEDIFHSNPGLFRQICNMNDTRNASENPFLSFSKLNQSFDKFPQNVHAQGTQSPKILMENPSSFADGIHELNLNESANTTGSSNLSGLGAKLEGAIAGGEAKKLILSTKNTSSTGDETYYDQDETEAENLEPEGKKRILNDRSEVNVDSKIVRKVGRPKKLNIKFTKKGLKTTSNQETSQAANTEGDAKVENKPVQPKAEDSQPNSTQAKMSNASEIGKLKVPENLKQILEGPNIPKDVQEFFKNSCSNLFETRKIGTLTVTERRAKVEKYLEKRKKRTWCRKINYDCRRRVADNRLRIKGRFVTREQAFILLEEAGVTFDPETITNPEIKTILTEKAGTSTLKKRNLGEQVGAGRKETEEKDDIEEDDDEEDQE